jgi:hypothetical protein
LKTLRRRQIDNASELRAALVSLPQKIAQATEAAETTAADAAYYERQKKPETIDRRTLGARILEALAENEMQPHNKGACVHRTSSIFHHQTT